MAEGLSVRGAYIFEGDSATHALPVSVGAVYTECVSKDDNWYWGKGPDGSIGFIAKDYVEECADSPPQPPPPPFSKAEEKALRMAGWTVHYDTVTRKYFYENGENHDRQDEKPRVEEKEQEKEVKAPSASAEQQEEAPIPAPTKALSAGPPSPKHVKLTGKKALKHETFTPPPKKVQTNAQQAPPHRGEGSAPLSTPNGSVSSSLPRPPSQRTLPITTKAALTAKIPGEGATAAAKPGGLLAPPPARTVPVSTKGAVKAKAMQNVRSTPPMDKKAETGSVTEAFAPPPPPAGESTNVGGLPKPPPPTETSQDGTSIPQPPVPAPSTEDFPPRRDVKALSRDGMGTSRSSAMFGPRFSVTSPTDLTSATASPSNNRLSRLVGVLSNSTVDIVDSLAREQLAPDRSNETLNDLLQKKKLTPVDARRIKELMQQQKQSNSGPTES